MEPWQKFVITASAVLLAMLIDRVIGVAVQAWGMRRMGAIIIRGVDATLKMRAEEYDATRQTASRRPN